jgi:hypothetical protein
MGLNSYYRGARLVKVETTITVPGKEALMSDIDMGMGKFDLRTLYVMPQTPNTYFDVAIYDGATTGFIVYKNENKSNVYDILEMPYVDIDMLEQVHMAITNRSNNAVTYDVIIQAIEVE